VQTTWGELAKQEGWLPIVDAYRTLCMAPCSNALAVLQRIWDLV
jgi:hypothetical protein